MQLSYTNKIEFWKISNAYHYFLFPRISKLFNNFLVLRTQYMESQKKKNAKTLHCINVMYKWKYQNFKNQQIT